MKNRLFAALVLAIIASPAFAASAATDTALTGAWRFEYACAGATGVYADRCAAGLRDSFTLSIIQNGSKVCGSYETTAQLGNHVDDGQLDDWTFQALPGHTFHVHYHLDGSVGEASVHVTSDELHWEELSESATGEDSAWSFHAPKTATLVRQSVNDGIHSLFARVQQRCKP